MPKISLAVVAAIFLTTTVGLALSAGLPTKVGQCSTTKITQTGSRLGRRAGQR